MRKLCEVEGCENPVVSAGNRKDSFGKPTTKYCDKHYARLKAHGTVEDNYRTHGTVEERFWRKVQKSIAGCWEWIGNLDSGGYGQLKDAGKLSGSLRAHRISFMIHKGEIPEGMVVMHTCDNRKCVNPDHLELGTYKDNTQDCVSKGRNAINVISRPGTMNGRAKVTEQDVLDIRNSDLSVAELSAKYRMSESGIVKIKRRYSWKHI